MERKKNEEREARGMWICLLERGNVEG